MAGERFNPNHGPAGSGHGGQFVAAAAAGSGGGKDKPAAAAGKGKPAAAAAGKAHDAPGHGHGSREELLAQARHDREKAGQLEKELGALEQQHKAAAAAARKSARQAAAAKKAGHIVHHHHHKTMHHHHRRHAESIAHQITSLKGRIHDLRQHAAELTAKAKAMRAAGQVTNPGGTEKLHEYWVHGAGAAKIGWGQPGDFDRCVVELGKYIRDPKGYCAKAHHDALGIWPAQHAAEMKIAGRADMAGKKPYGNETYADPKNGKYPLTKNGKLDRKRIHAAWSYINQADNAAQYPMNGVALSEVKARIKAAAKQIGMEISEGNSAPADGEIRTVPFDVTSAEASGDGLTFEGYAAVYDSPTRIAGWEGDFDEQISPGAFRAIAAGKYPVLMFDHGKHPLIGSMPLGRITDAREDPQGLFITARLTDNWLIQPVRDAIADQAITGMSFRFTPDDGGELWMDQGSDIPLRTLTSVSVPELGPVVFPAYTPTTASVRSQLDRLPVIGRPAAGAAAASGRDRGEPDGELQQALSRRFSRDGEALALRGIGGVRL